MSGNIGVTYAFSAVITALAYTVLAVLVFASKKRAPATILWASLCVALVVLWLGIGLPTLIALPPTLEQLLLRLTFTAGTLATWLALAFVSFFLGSRRGRRGGLGIAALWGAALLGLTWFSDLIFGGMMVTSSGFRVPESRPLIGVYDLYCSLGAAISVVLLAWSYRRASGRVRLQLAYVMAAMVLLVTAAAGNLLPMSQPNSALVLLPSALGMIVAPAIITYAIIRHQLWDIRTAIHKTVLWVTASLLIIIPAYFLLEHAPAHLERFSPLRALGGALLLFLLFLVHFRLVQPWINHLFARGRYDSTKVVDAFNRQVVNLRGVQELEKLVRETIGRAAYATRVHMYVMPETDDPAAEEQCSVVAALPSSVNEWLVRYAAPVDVSLLEAEGPPEEEATLVLKICHEYEISVLLPLIDEQRLIGVVAVGEKQDLQAYTRNDFVLLESMRPAITVALANGRLYDQLQALTDSLEKRVAQRTEELRTANEQLQESDRQKSKFFANVTHELRTPLTMIVAPLEDLLLREEGEPALLEELQLMHRNAQRLLEQINALLDLARLDAGALRLEISEVRLSRLVEAAVHTFTPLAQREQLRLEFAGLAGEATIMGDPTKLELVFSNLLANAVKFTPAGGEIHVWVTADEEYITVAVRDTGIGIPADQLERIFDRFAQVEGGPTRRYDGAGIGLALVKEIVGLHDGAIELDSHEGEGSEFRIKLRRGGQPQPIDSAPEEQSLSAERPVVRKRSPTALVPVPGLDGESLASETATARPRVLIVEDNVDMRTYLTRRLKDRFAIECCADGVTALERVAQRVPDLVVSDVMMPELSGVELCQRLKSEPATAQVPVILITARKAPDRLLEGFQAGADDYLTKPFNLQELRARIEVQLRLAEMTRKLAAQEKHGMFSLVAAGLAHEVRNPITGILNAVRLLREGQVLAAAEPAARQARDEMLRVILEAAERIDRLCADLLGVASPHGTGISEWPLAEAVDSAVRLIRHRRAQEIAAKCLFGHRAPVFGRPSQLNQVLLNLLDNAVRAAGPGGQVEVLTDEEDGCFRLHVRDSGPGLPQGKEQQVFDPFYTTHAREGSSGLGLSICRRIVEEHGGRIVARNLPTGHGAEFTVELPCGEGAALR